MTRPRRVHIDVEGSVQGVGFRPWVHARATDLALAGWVRNGPGGVCSEVEGPADAIASFVAAIRDGGPPRAVVRGVSVTEREPTDATGFTVVDSDVETVAAPGAPALAADIVVCERCRTDLDDLGGRRHEYAFTSCAECGPRYTITTRMPYDRAGTTMAPFALCAACAGEYADVADRRFHAETTACAVCGPTVRFGIHTGPAAIAEVARTITAGGVVAVKGIGGYQLVADAACETAVRLVREIKARPDRPLAVMVADLAAAERLCRLGDLGRAELSSPAGPVVLAPRRNPSPLAPSVAPDVDAVGVMLPTSPLHHVLLASLGRAVVATSGNRSGEPIARDTAELGPLADLVDGVLDHDRAVHVRCDDSVVAVGDTRRQVVRRARGFVPQPVGLVVAAPEPVLALGGQLKVTVAVAAGDHVVASQHLGDLSSPATLSSLEDAVAHLCRLCRVDPEIVVCDVHPGYVTTKMALSSGLKVEQVQHHHAHAAACLTEHGEAGPALVVAFDGHGWGPDATLWGGEFLVADLWGFRRVGCIRPVPLPGGEATVRAPWRMALAWLHADDADRAARWGAERSGTDTVLGLCADPATIATSSAGRVFDAAAAICGLGDDAVSFEGQAAMALEAAAASADTAHTTLETPVLSTRSDALLQLDPGPLLASLAEAASAGVAPGLLAQAFTAAFAGATARAAARCAADAGLGTVVLTGGVMQNLAFESAVADQLRASGLAVLLHEDVPANDGGLSIGQAAIAAARLNAQGAMSISTA